MAWNHILDHWAQAIDRMQPGHAGGSQGLPQGKGRNGTVSSMPLQSTVPSSGVLDGTAIATGAFGPDVKGAGPPAIKNPTKPLEM